MRNLARQSGTLKVERKSKINHSLLFEALQASSLDEETVVAAIAKLYANIERNRPLHLKAMEFFLRFVRRERFNTMKIRLSPFFDEKFYLSQNQDVATANIDPALHYLNYGAREGRNPGPYFSTVKFQQNFSAVSDRKYNPLLEYHRRLKYGLPLVEIAKKQNGTLSQQDRISIKRHVQDFVKNKKISVAMPVFNPHPPYLEAAIESVQAQLYPHWELCIANDASTNPNIAKILDRFAAEDKRIKVVHRDVNGHISQATNSAIKIATGEFIALMDHDDVLAEEALYEVALVIESTDDIDVIYSDSDAIDQSGIRQSPFYKPDFNVELLLGLNLVSHLGVYRASLVQKVGGLRKGYEGSQDYDLILRVLAQSKPSRIKHIQSILYHWRQGGAQKSFSEAHLDKCVAVARQAIQDYLDHEGEGATVTSAPASPQYSRVKRKLSAPLPLVTCIIPTRDRLDLLTTCLDGLLQNTAYSAIEVIIVDNESKERATLAYFKNIQKNDSRVRVVRYDGKFNYSAINNFAAKQAKGSLLAFINNDIEIQHSDWLDEMVSHAVRPDVGAVGAKLHYPNGKIQHAGVVIGLGGAAGHLLQTAPGESLGDHACAVLTRQVSAVTAACMVVKKDAFLEVGGFDEINLTVAFNDTDLCLKLQEAGYRNIFTPFAQLIHHESISRGIEDTQEKQMRFRSEVTYFKEKWAKIIENDPFYNTNLSLDFSDVQVAEKTRRKKPWAKYI